MGAKILTVLLLMRIGLGLVSSSGPLGNRGTESQGNSHMRELWPCKVSSMTCQERGHSRITCRKNGNLMIMANHGS